ncbi:MAG: EamA family transporter [Actinomycetales bacterium]|nr:EamA family transporter [Actinomycetales bacterium]
MSPAARGAVAVLAAATLFGTSATSLALLAPGAPGPGVAAMRLLVGSLGLLAFVAWRGHLAAVRRLWRRPTTWVMGLAVAGYQAFFFIGTSRTGVAVGTLVSLALAPFLAGVLGWLLREGAPGWVWAVSTVIAVVGVTLLLSGGVTAPDPVGALAAASAGGCYAVYTVIGVRLSRDGGDPGAVLASSFSVGALVLLPAAVASTWWWSPAGVVAVMWLGLGATTVAYLLFGVGLAVLQPGHIATLNLLEPAVATLLGVAVLGEALGVLGGIGCVLVFAALALLGIMENVRRPSDDGGSERERVR